MSSRSAGKNVKGATKFYRPPYEAISAVAALLAALVYIVIARTGEGEISTFVSYVAIPLLGLAAYRAWQTWDNLCYKTRLTTPLPPDIPIAQLLAKQRHKQQVFLGKGFLWEPDHARVMKEISSLGSKRVMEPPGIFRKIVAWGGLAARIPLEGQHYIHGVGQREDDLFVSFRSRASHTLVLGTNGSGKTRLLETLIAQSISRGTLSPSERAKHGRLMEQIAIRDEQVKERIHENPEHTERLRAQHLEWRDRVFTKIPMEKCGPVIVIDPKSDPDMLCRAYQIAKQCGRESQFHYFSPTRPNCSFRLNPLANYTRLTELANRIVALMPTGGESEAFKQFAWRAVNVVVSGLDAVGMPITLVSIKRYIDGGLGQLLEPCLERHFLAVESHYPDWRSRVETIRRRTANKSELAARIVHYAENVRNCHPDIVIDGMIQVLEHDAAHYSKLISNLIPILEQLTSGPMERLLSPKYPEPDNVEATNFQRLIDDKRIVYINLDSLADSVVGTALGSLFLADLTACAARRHALGISEPPVAIYVDEAAEVINDPMIQLLGKGRSSGFELTLASQTVADFTARLGDQAKALQVLGNVNCLIAMRVLDDESLKMVTEKFAETTYAEASSSRTSTTIAAIAQRGRDYSGSVMKGSQSKDVPLVDADLLRSLPPGHFFGHFPGGIKYKGRVMLMPDIPANERFIPEKDGRLNVRPEFCSGNTEARSPTRLQQIVLDDDPRWYDGSEMARVPFVSD